MTKSEKDLVLKEFNYLNTKYHFEQTTILNDFIRFGRNDDKLNIEFWYENYTYQMYIILIYISDSGFQHKIYFKSYLDLKGDKKEVEFTSTKTNFPNLVKRLANILRLSIEEILSKNDDDWDSLIKVHKNDLKLKREEIDKKRIVNQSNQLWNEKKYKEYCILLEDTPYELSSLQISRLKYAKRKYRNNQ
ncbi:MAG: hypothetical protein AB7E09_00705 [Candidatus Izemoplasmatales bacterium]